MHLRLLLLRLCQLAQRRVGGALQRLKHRVCSQWQEQWAMSADQAVLIGSQLTLA